MKKNNTFRTRNNKPRKQRPKGTKRSRERLHRREIFRIVRYHENNWVDQWIAEAEEHYIWVTRARTRYSEYRIVTKIKPQIITIATYIKMLCSKDRISYKQAQVLYKNVQSEEQGLRAAYVRMLKNIKL